MAIKTPRTPQYRTLFYGPTPKILARQKSGEKIREIENKTREKSQCNSGTVSAVVNLFNISLGGERASRRANCCCNERWQRRWVNLL
uniref:Uncharacterized protein n=1 Tax=Salix viminalis TaxID=40686 RepID=A0A6N2NE50_SALVM